MNKILSTYVLCCFLLGCLPPPQPGGGTNPVGPGPVAPLVDGADDFLPPANTQGLDVSIPAIMAKYHDKEQAKKDSLSLAYLYHTLADQIRRDGQTDKPQLTTVGSLTALNDSAKNFRLRGTDFESIIRRYPELPKLMASVQQSAVPSFGQAADAGVDLVLSADGKDRSNLVAGFDAIAFGLWTAYLKL